MSSHITPTGDESSEEKKIVPIYGSEGEGVDTDKELIRTLTQVKVSPLAAEQVNQPIQDVAQEQFDHYERDHQRILVFYHNKKLPFAAHKECDGYLSYLFSNESFYMKWIKASAERMQLEIATERSEKRKRKFWAALKERFLNEIKKYAA